MPTVGRLHEPHSEVSGAPGEFCPCMRCDVKPPSASQPTGPAMAKEALWSLPTTVGCPLGFRGFLRADLTGYALCFCLHRPAGAVGWSTGLPFFADSGGKL